MSVDVVIAGAGPTGLVAALWLTHLGVRVRIVDKTSEPGTTSRALAVQARTLELYDQLGLADAVVEHGHKVPGINLWVRGRHAARASLGELGDGISPYAFALVYPQDEHERLLIDRLAALDVHVERQTSVTGFEETANGVRVQLRREGAAEETCDCRYLAGCDGAHSIVRESIGVGFPGAQYEHLFYVADVEGNGPAFNGEINVSFDRHDFLAVFPLKRDGHARFVGTVRDDGRARDALTWDDVQTGVMGQLKLTVARVNWFSTYRVHHRVAEHFRRGRAFLAGDAAHIHSPVGGQGMNTGIGDAINLAWKLAAVIQGRAAASLRDSYEPERIAFARRLVATTDQGFTAATSDGAIARFLRMDVLPVVLPLLFSVPASRRFLFRTVSQTSVNYRQTPFNEGHAGGVHGGDRLPWIRGAAPDGGDNFALLTSLAWQAHVYGDARAELRAFCVERTLPVHVFAWRDDMHGMGLLRDALYLIRPDGYVALADAGQQPDVLARYLDARGIRF